MLILTRKIGEVVKIGDDIKVYVLDVRGAQVRLGFVAPDDMLIVRGEKPQRARKIVGVLDDEH